MTLTAQVKELKKLLAESDDVAVRLRMDKCPKEDRKFWDGSYSRVLARWHLRQSRKRPKVIKATDRK